MINMYVGGVVHDILHQHRTNRDAQVIRYNHLSRWRDGGLTGAVVQIASWSTVGMILSEIERSEGELVYCTNRSAFENRPEGSFGIFFSCEGHGPYAGDLDALYVLSQLGITAFTFSHNLQNLLCTGSNEKFEGGFTHLGKATLKELESLPMMVDLVHMSRKSFWDAVDIYEGDLFVSHSNAAAVFEHPRNITDDQIKVVAERNGVIGLNTYRGYVTPDPFKATLSDLLDHAMHVYDLVGPEHMSIGADYCEAPIELLAPVLDYVDPDGAHGVGLGRGAEIYQYGPEGIEDSGRLNKLAVGFAERGLSQEEIDLISGEAYLRMLERVRPSTN